MEKSANKRWKESGSTLGFKEWIDRENKKNSSELNLPFEDDTASIYEVEEVETPTENFVGLVTEEDKSKVFGLDKNILIFSGILIVGSIAYLAYKKFKKNK
jgi:hypothetical protein